MPQTFQIALTADFKNIRGELVYRDVGLDVLPSDGATPVQFLAEHRPEIGSEQLRGVNGVVVLTPRVTAASLSASENLLAVGRFGVGFDSVDVAACTAADVVLFIAVGAVDRSVAEATVGWMLALRDDLGGLRCDRPSRCRREEFHVGVERLKGTRSQRAVLALSALCESRRQAGRSHSRRSVQADRVL